MINNLPTIFKDIQSYIDKPILTGSMAILWYLNELNINKNITPNDYDFIFMGKQVDELRNKKMLINNQECYTQQNIPNTSLTYSCNKFSFDISRVLHTVNYITHNNINIININDLKNEYLLLDDFDEKYDKARDKIKIIDEIIEYINKNDLQDEYGITKKNNDFNNLELIKEIACNLFGDSDNEHNVSCNLFGFSDDEY